MNYSEMLFNRDERLIQIIEKLKQTTKDYKQTIDTYENKRYREHIENEMLRDRIDKAIEYINEMTLTSDGYANYGDDLRPEHIVKILKGSDKE